MYYSIPTEDTPIYEIDDDGNIKEIEVDGKMVKVPTGQFEKGYSKPTEFRAVITNKLNEVLARNFGIDESTHYAQITAPKGYLSALIVGALVWKKSEIVYKDEIQGIIDDTSADYTVKGIADEGLAYDLFLLQRNVK